jgi:hypothetical protein
LDALNPTVLRARVETEIRALIDWAPWERGARVEAAEQATLAQVLGSWQAVGA